MSSSQDTESLGASERALETCLTCGEIIAGMSRAAFILRQKRTTLEEKAISRYFHQTVRLLGIIVAELHMRLESGSEEVIGSVNLNLLKSTVEDLKSRVDELLKILHYNLNFLEQYFEYDFFAKLSTESNAIENLQVVYDELTAQRG